MAVHSTGKMLASMTTKSKGQAVAVQVERSVSTQDLEMPLLTPDAEMEQVLANILGAGANKKHSPMDK